VPNGSKIGAMLERETRHDRGIARDGLDGRARLVRAQKNLGNSPVTVEAGAKREGEPAVRKLERLALPPVGESLAGASHLAASQMAAGALSPWQSHFSLWR